MSDEKKIIIDEDWKSQVAREKEEADKRSAEVENEPPPADAGFDAGAPLPEASFEMLITTFASEAMIALGQFPHPATGQLAPDPEHARYAIDMLEIIAEKTKGNLSPSEDAGLQDIIHQLRMAYVAITTHPAAGQ